MDLSAGGKVATSKQQLEANRPLEMLEQTRQQAGIVQETRALTRVGNKENQQVFAEVGTINEDTNQQLCFACRKSLSKSRHLINVAGQGHRWHSECFRCSICLEPMDRQNSCHLYRGEIVCRQDYAKLQRDHSVKCARCRWPIGPADWVRKAASHVYHLACFTCDICHRQLSTGEQFTVRQASGSTLPTSSGQQQQQVKLLCRLHFAISEPPPPPSNSPTASEAQQLYSHHPHHQPCHLNLFVADSSLSSTGKFTPIQDYHHLPSLASASGAEQHHRHPDDIYEEVSMSAATVGDMGDQVAGTSTGSSNGSTSNGGVGQLLANSKSKRVRTTFTEDQLSILQTQFQVDSNPDGQDLERIATITGLSKRVTQVWFQNSRARQKKYMIKRKPTNCQQQSNSGANANIQNFNQHHHHQHQQQANAQVVGAGSNRLCNWSVAAGGTGDDNQHLEAIEALASHDLGDDCPEDDEEDADEEDEEELQSDVDQLMAPSSSNCGVEDSN